MVPLDQVFDDAARTYEVPAPVLQALSWEASHWNPDAESGPLGKAGARHGLFGLDAERAARIAGLIGQEPEDLLTDPALQVQGAAALLKAQWDLAHPGTPPNPKDIAAWWDPIRAFSGSSSPVRQERFATYIFEVMAEGRSDGVLTLSPVSSVWFLVPPPPPPSATCDYGGCADYEQACAYSSDTRGPADIDIVVIHTVQGSYEACISWFADCDAGSSAHYVVRSDDGAITQMVDESDVAWHAGDWDTNARSVGIEHEGFVDEPDLYYTDAMYRASADLVLDISARQGVPLDRDHIIGHFEVPGCPDGSGGGASCHTDPGDGWDWDYFLSLMTGETVATLLGVVADSDIYNGTRLAGAAVWIEGSDATCVASETGIYAFEGLPLEATTVWAEVDGYDPGSCTVELEAGENWCSIALVMASSGSDDTAASLDTGGTPTPADTDDAASPADTGPADTGPPETRDAATKQLDSSGGCSTVGGAPWTLPLALGLVLRRRQPRVVASR